MPRGRPIEPVVLTDDEKDQLLSLANSRSLPHGVVRRAQIVLACAQGEANASIARRMRLSDATVGKWRKRYRMQGIEGLHDELRAGRPRTHDVERAAEFTAPCALTDQALGQIGDRDPSERARSWHRIHARLMRSMSTRLHPSVPVPV